MERNDSRKLEKAEEENDEDLIEEAEPCEEQPEEIPSFVPGELRGERLLGRFRLRGIQAEEVVMFSYH